MGNGALAIGPKLPRPSSTLPTLPTWALHQVVGYLRHTDRGSSVSMKAARDPMYGPAVRRKRFHRSDDFAVLHQCIRPLIGTVCAPGHHGYQRACVLISGQASSGPFGSPGFACAGTKSTIKVFWSRSCKAALADARHLNCA